MDASSSKRYFSWAAIHKSIRETAIKTMADFKPTLIVAISGGGLVPARILRTMIKAKTCKNLPVQCIGLTLYDDDDVMGAHVTRTQWISPDCDLSGQAVLLVDEVDDSRKTLAFAAEEMLRYFDEVEAKCVAEGKAWKRPSLGIFVVHNKLRPKAADLPAAVFPHNYFAQDMQNRWHLYPWDAIDIDLHETLASAQDAQEGGIAIRRQPSRGSNAYASEDPISALIGSPTLKAALGGAGWPQLTGASGSPALRAACMSKAPSIASSLHALTEEGQHSSLGSSYTEHKLLA